MNKPPIDFFAGEAAQKYDERNSKLSRILDALHFLTGLVLKGLPAESLILCVGAGTGAEIIYLAKVFPRWRFVALEPSLSMLDICRARITQAGLADRCEFVHGYVQDLPARAGFDAVLSMLVAHFVQRQDRPGFLRQIVDHLRVGGTFVTAEISLDLDAAEFPSLLEKWAALHELAGATPESLSGLPKQLKEVLTVLPYAETEALLREAGVDMPVRFFQAFMICAWYGQKVG